MLRGLSAVKQPTVLDGFAFDPFSFQQDGLAAPEVDVGWGEIVDALVITPVVVIGGERIDLGFEVAGQFDPVTVTGTIKTETAFTGIADAGYSIDAESVEPRKK